MILNWKFIKRSVEAGFLNFIKVILNADPLAKAVNEVTLMKE